MHGYTLIEQSIYYYNNTMVISSIGFRAIELTHDQCMQLL